MSQQIEYAPSMEFFEYFEHCYVINLPAREHARGHGQRARLYLKSNQRTQILKESDGSRLAAMPGVQELSSRLPGGS